jgi:hypothetical protein
MKRAYWFWKDSSGSAVWFVAIFMFVIAGLLAFVIDLAHVMTVKTELSNAADSAALAGARSLMPLTGEGEPPWPMEDPPTCDAAMQAALDTSVLNYIDTGPKQKSIHLDPTEVITGVWDFEARTFTPSACNSDTNAVKVTTRASGDLPQGPVDMTLAKIFGVDTMNPSATAIAAVGYLETLPEKAPGGFLAMDNDYLQKAWDLTDEGKNDIPFYLVFGPALGKTSYEYADNGSWALPSDGYESFNPTITDYIADGTTNDVSVTEYVDLKNGQMANLMKNLQDAIAAAEGALDSAVYGVYEDDFGASVGDMWNEKSTKVDSFWTVQLTDAWKSTEINKDPRAQDIINQMYPDLNDQNKIVGLIEFKLTGPVAYGGNPGSGLPSNTHGFLVKLVE